MSTSTMMPTTLTVFNAAINAIRDILRKEGITGMDSMKHCTLYILARALDKKECERLKISQQYSWDKFKELMKIDSKRQECFDLLYNKNGNDLISYLDDIFGTRNFNFKLKNPDNHIAILKIINAVDLKELEGKVDILGTVYENHLGSGSNKSAMRDLGQFFTDRRICKYMTNLCNPQYIGDGIVESVLDPTMGTAGFLTSYVNKFKDDNIPVIWSKMQMDIAGYDIDEFVMSIGRINMYLSTGVIFDRIAHRDTLHNDIGETHQRLKFKVILANMPFGVKGLKFADCCRRVKEIKCDGTKSEPLFLNLMMAALDEGGRCAVVAPEGVLVNNSKQHNSTRKYLLDNFELKRVIKMKGQFFSNTGIQPSILFFEKTGKKTSTIEFWEVEQDTNGDIVETMISSLPSSSLDESYSLDVRRYEENVAAGNTGGFPTVLLSEVIECKNGKNIPERDRLESGAYPYYASNGIKGYVNESLFEGPATLLGDQGSAWHTSTHFVETNSKFYAGNHTIVMKTKDATVLDTKYVYYYLLMNDLQRFNKTAALIPELDKERFYASTLPLPPLTIQKEIISALDLIYKNATAASTAAESLKAQMAAVVHSLIKRGYKQKTLGDLANGENGKGLSMEETKANPGNYPILSGGQNYCGTFGKFNRNENIISISKSGSSSGFVKWNPTKFWASDCFTISSKDQNSMNNQFLYYILSLQQETIYQKYQIKGTIPHCYWRDMESMMIPVPPLAFQEKTVKILNEMETERKVLEQMAAKAEERARFVFENYLQPVEEVIPEEDELVY